MELFSKDLKIDSLEYIEISWKNLKIELNFNYFLKKRN